jgi:signal transduction histidine kinase
MIEDTYSTLMREQLKQSCKYSNARWAVWLEPIGSTWELHSQSGLSRARLQWLQSFIQEKKTIVWLAGAFSSRRRRTKDLGETKLHSGCKYLVLFPASSKRQLLLVGTDNLGNNFDAFWRVIALEPPESARAKQHLPDLSQLEPNTDALIEEVSFDLSSIEILRLLSAIQENVIELTRLAQKLDIRVDEATGSLLTNSIQELLQQFLHRARLLLDVPFAQLGWIEHKQVFEKIPHALDREHSTQFHSFVTDVAPDRNSRFPFQPETIIPLHSYIATIGENVLTNDLISWMSLLDQQQPAKNVRVMNTELDEGIPYSCCHSIIGVPLRYDGSISGSLVFLDDRAEKNHSEKDLFLLKLLIPQLEIAIGYARLNSLLKERITAQNLAESRLVRSARLAAVGEMAAGVAHELNNPLTTVTGFVELVLNELPSDSPLHADLDLVLKEALRARGIVRGLLDFSRPSQDQRIPSDLNDIISQVLNLIRHMLRMNNLSIRLELWDDLPLVVVDPNKIQQVLHNLMQNAIRAMPHGGTLTIRTSPNQKPSTIVEADEHKWVSFLIQDTGVGIPADDLGRIFEPFYTHQHSDRIDEPGIGLGLSISYGIIQSHGGVIEIASEINQGSRFTVYLPLGEQ